MSEKKHADVFAEIAGLKQTGNRTQALIEPAPDELSVELLPLESNAKHAFKTTSKLDSIEKLQAELREMREKHAPFLKNLAPDSPETRETLNLDTFQWRLEDRDAPSDFVDVLEGRGDWEKVEIPHYGGPLGKATAWYRAEFMLTKGMIAKGALYACFKGVDYKASVFVNGALVGTHEGFFAPFECDFTQYARKGKNTLVVRVENDAICMGNNSWQTDDEEKVQGDKIYAATGCGYDDPAVGWHHCPPGMGIYQDVSIEARAAIHVHDIFVRPILEEKRAELWVELNYRGVYDTDYTWKYSVYGQNFKAKIVEDVSVKTTAKLGPGVNYVRTTFELDDLKTWTPDEPWLYQVQVSVGDAEGIELDRRVAQFGMRSFSMDEDSEPKGRMYFNGREIRLRGANTMGHLQQCVLKKDWEQLKDDILLAKICNMNFLRLTQRPVQKEIYEYCDKLGLMLQTDLPLFGFLRRNQFCETVRQAEEMERLIRCHPSNIMVSYINEPFPDWPDRAPRHLLRHELERFFECASHIIHVNNPDRVVKNVDGDYNPPTNGLPDNHCYCGWYNGHAVDLGKLHKGYWTKIKPGWMFGCGEFGAEGLENVDIMRAHYPKDWLPQNKKDEKTWLPDNIVRAQTGKFHYMWFDTQHELEGWIEKSQKHQEWVNRLMTEAFRRKSHMNTFAIHLFIDAFPSGWMKTIMDFKRRPKPTFFTYRDALTPLMTNLRTDRHAYFGDEEAMVEAWVCNDLPERKEGLELRYQIENEGKVIRSGKRKIVVEPSSSACHGLLKFKTPSVKKRKTIFVKLALVDKAGKVSHHTSLELEIFPVSSVSKARDISIIGSSDGIASKLASDLGLDVKFGGDLNEKSLILIDDYPAFETIRDDVETAVRSGAKAIFLDLPEGEFSIGGDTVVVSAQGMEPVHFVSRATGHSMVKKLHENDLKFWFDASVDYITPILSHSVDPLKNWDAILKSGNGKWGEPWKPTFAAAEKKDGKGAWRFCQLKLVNRTKHNPAAKIMAAQLLELDS